MSKKLNITFVILFISYLCQGQNPCNISTVTPHFIFYAGPSYNFTMGSFSTTPRLYLCRNAIVYDTTGINNTDRFVMIDQGAQYTWKIDGPAASGIYIKSGGTLNLVQSQSAGPVFVSIESGATVNDPFNLLNGPPDTCATITLPTVNCATSLTEQTKDQLIHLFPNPTSNNSKLQIDFEITAGLFSVSTLLGKVIRQQNILTGSNNIDFSELSNGLYYYTIYDKGKVISNGKFVIK